MRLRFPGAGPRRRLGPVRTNPPMNDLLALGILGAAIAGAQALIVLCDRLSRAADGGTGESR